MKGGNNHELIIERERERKIERKKKVDSSLEKEEIQSIGEKERKVK